MIIIPETDLFNLAEYQLLGGVFTFESWGVCSGIVETLLPPPVNAKIISFIRRLMISFSSDT